jgi:hypothetical protein
MASEVNNIKKETGRAIAFLDRNIDTVFLTLCNQPHPVFDVEVRVSVQTETI